MSATHLPSIRQRLATAVLAVSLAWGLLASAAVWFTVQHEVDELLDQTLQESAEILYGLLSYNAAALPLGSGQSMPAPPHEEHLVWQIVNAQGQVLLRSHRAPAQALASPAQAGFSDAGTAWRVFGMPLDGAQRLLLVGQRGDERQEARREAATLTAAGALLVGVLCAWVLRQVLRRELQPVTALSQAIAHFDPVNAPAALPPPRRAELVPVHTALVALGTRVARHIASERAVAAHAAHALRTPLAGMVSQLAAAQQRGNAEVQPFLARTREAATRLRQVVAALLTLFRSGAEPALTEVPLARLAAHLPVNGVQVEVPADARIHADEDLLAAALMNLLDNAQRVGASRVWLSVRHSPGWQHLTVRDNGPGLPPARRAQLQAALNAQQYEGDDGLGLGLVLADLVCRAHGGQLRLLEAGLAEAAGPAGPDEPAGPAEGPQPQPGFEVELALPYAVS